MSTRAPKLVATALGVAIALGAIAFLAFDEGGKPPGKRHNSTPTGRVASNPDPPTTVRDLPLWLQEATLEPGSAPTPLRAVRPSSGEGAPRTQLPAEEKADTAVAGVEKAIDEIRGAETDEERAELRELAAAKLSGVRAELWATEEGKAVYKELQNQIEGV